MRVYVAGPISGIENHNEPEFRLRQNELEAKGFECLVPHDISPYHPEKIWSDYMRECIPALCRCDGISILNGWNNSKGAKLEIEIAKALDLQFI